MHGSCHGYLVRERRLWEEVVIFTRSGGSRACIIVLTASTKCYLSQAENAHILFLAAVVNACSSCGHVERLMFYETRSTTHALLVKLVAKYVIIFMH